MRRRRRELVGRIAGSAAVDGVPPFPHIRSVGRGSWGVSGAVPSRQRGGVDGQPGFGAVFVKSWSWIRFDIQSQFD